VAVREEGVVVGGCIGGRGGAVILGSEGRRGGVRLGGGGRWWPAGDLCRVWVDAFF
jgi:hypothetical protein